MKKDGMSAILFLFKNYIIKKLEKFKKMIIMEDL